MRPLWGFVVAAGSSDGKLGGGGFVVPPLDVHAHVDPDIGYWDLVGLGAVVLVALRTQDEFDQVTDRDDPVTVWGVGVHPGVVAAVKGFDRVRLCEQLERTPLLSEVGLDRRSVVSDTDQERVFEQILDVHDQVACVASVHSAGRSGRVLDMLEGHRCSTVMLHWWTGSVAQTVRAVELGCYFSVNARNVRSLVRMGVVPADRLLVETDHPFGDRGYKGLPGGVVPVEEVLAAEGVCDRTDMWRNFGGLVGNGAAAGKFSAALQGVLRSVGSGD